MANIKTEDPNILAIKWGKASINAITLVHGLMLSKYPPLGLHGCKPANAELISVFNPALVSIKTEKHRKYGFLWISQSN